MQFTSTSPAQGKTRTGDREEHMRGAHGNTDSQRQDPIRRGRRDENTAARKERREGRLSAAQKGGQRARETPSQCRLQPSPTPKRSWEKLLPSVCVTQADNTEGSEGKGGASVPRTQSTNRPAAHPPPPPPTALGPH